MKRIYKLITIMIVFASITSVQAEAGAEPIYYTDTLQTESDLNIYGKAWLKGNYNMDLKIKIYIANCEGDLQGIFVHDKGEYIVIGNKLINNNSIPCTRVERVLRHELIHYALYKQNKEFWDGSKVFEREVQDKIAISNNGDIPVMESSNVKNIDEELQAD